MGKHKEKSKKQKKEKKHKKQKRHHSSSESISSSGDEWVEKVTGESTSSSKPQTEKQEDPSTTNREDWMSLPSSFLSSSNIDRRQEREEKKRLEREREQYNPRECPRELNPYWKDGGDGLPQFKKPRQDDYEEDRSPKGSKAGNKRIAPTTGWRKKSSMPSKQEPIEDDYRMKSNIISSRREDSPPQQSNDVSSPEVLSDKELNALAAKLVKAEIMGNTKLMQELKEKLENARKLREMSPAATSRESEQVILTQTDSTGQVRPLKLQADHRDEPSSSGNKKKKQKVETHQGGERVRYFADDDKYSLKQMFEQEKFNTIEDQNAEFLQLAGKVRKNDDLDDIFTDNIRRKQSDGKIDSKNKDRAISEHQKVSQSLDHCTKCLQSDKMLKHLMVTMNDTAYLSLPVHEPLTEGHCFIVPIRHVVCQTQLDENEWSDLMDFRKALTKMYQSKGEDVVFFEIATYLNKFPHMHVECVPLPKEEGDLAPIYFKKAIDESEYEWAQNKKLVSMKGKDVRRCIPKGLPYFCVSFGMEEGFAHVIEDEQSFPHNFAQEIIGGMLDLHHSKWRKPRRTKFEEQSKRVLEFSKDWKPFDFTTKA